MPEHLDSFTGSLAANTSRRGFLARVSGALMAAAGGGAVVKAVVKPGDAGAYHLCGHIFTTGSCPHPPRCEHAQRLRQGSIGALA